MPVIRLALAQINSCMGNFAANAATMRSALETARLAKADLIVFPELALSGYPPEDLLLRDDFLREQARVLTQWKQATGDMLAVVGYAQKNGGRVYNAAAVFHNRRFIGCHQKHELPNYGVFDEKRYFTPGREPFTFERDGLQIAVTICEDIWIEGGAVERTCRRNRPDLVLNLAASPYHAGKVDLRRRILRGFARRVGSHVAYVNLVGGQDELVFDGGSMVVDPQGRVLARGKSFQTDLLIGDLDIPRRRHRRGRQVAGVWKPHPQRRPLPKAGVQPLLEQIHQALVLGTRDYVQKNGFQTVVVGLSGGVDSSLVACLAVEALGREHVIGVTLPSHYTSAATRSDALALAQRLGIRCLQLSIAELVRSYQSHLKKIIPESLHSLTRENVQARIRGNLLMALSNQYGWMVLTTGNKSETAVGYCTLYGDMAGGFAVIKDVPKLWVYRLARQFNQQWNPAPIPVSVLRRAPTAELRPGQKDTDSLPAYTLLDPILKAYIEDNRFQQRRFEKTVVARVIRMVDQSEYKRRQAPPGIKITPKAFGRDRRLPITNQYLRDHDGKGK